MSRPSCGGSPFSPAVVFFSMISGPDELPSDPGSGRTLRTSFPDFRMRVLARNVESRTKVEMLRRAYHERVELLHARRDQSNLWIYKERLILRVKKVKKGLFTNDGSSRRREGHFIIGVTKEHFIFGVGSDTGILSGRFVRLFIVGVAKEHFVVRIGDGAGRLSGRFARLFIVGVTKEHFVVRVGDGAGRLSGRFARLFIVGVTEEHFILGFGEGAGGLSSRFATSAGGGRPFAFVRLGLGFSPGHGGDDFGVSWRVANLLPNCNL